MFKRQNNRRGCHPPPSVKTPLIYRQVFGVIARTIAQNSPIRKRCDAAPRDVNKITLLTA